MFQRESDVSPSEPIDLIPQPDLNIEDIETDANVSEHEKSDSEQEKHKEDDESDEPDNDKANPVPDNDQAKPAPDNDKAKPVPDNNNVDNHVQDKSSTVQQQKGKNNKEKLKSIDEEAIKKQSIVDLIEAKELITATFNDAKKTAKESSVAARARTNDESVSTASPKIDKVNDLSKQKQDKSEAKQGVKSSLKDKTTTKESTIIRGEKSAKATAINKDKQTAASVVAERNKSSKPATTSSQPSIAGKTTFASTLKKGGGGTSSLVTRTGNVPLTRALTTLSGR